MQQDMFDQLCYPILQLIMLRSIALLYTDILSIVGNTFFGSTAGVF